ncbi:DUF3558 domain-containing protein [Saccharothrix saharensis]|uniref:DUF3558 domain-containing protein n=1 Tax=Saccharothrix saharensis TaxID=571190 RepID=UPI0036936AB5
MPRPAPFVFALLAFAVTACSPGTPTPTGTSSAAATTTGRAEAAPSVAGLREEPCTGLTAEQAASFDLAPGKPISDVGHGPGCMWLSPSHDANVVNLSFDDLGGGGLARIRANRADHAYHDEVGIGDYPAIFASSFDLRSEGDCTLWVGVADGLVMTLGASLPGGPDAADPCSAAERIATAIAANLGNT